MYDMQLYDNGTHCCTRQGVVQIIPAALEYLEFRVFRSIAVDVHLNFFNFQVLNGFHLDSRKVLGACKRWLAKSSERNEIEIRRMHNALYKPIDTGLVTSN